MRAGVTLTREEREKHCQRDLQPRRPDVASATARLLSEAIVRLYRLTGWPPARVALELAAATGGSRRDVLRWAQDGVPRCERDALFARIEELEERHRPAWRWNSGRVEHLRAERGWSRLDLAIEADLTVQRVREIERGATPSRAEAARIMSADQEGDEDDG